jgi:hypothetical protein
VIESGARLVDWGIARVVPTDGNGFVLRLDAMLAKYRPTVLAVEDTANPRRGETAMRRVDRAVGLARFVSIEPVLVSRGEVRRTLSAAIDATRDDVALLLAGMFPELAPQLPPKRRVWESEDERMKIFDAVGLAAAGVLLSC